jgi:hypothetical protein
MLPYGRYDLLWQSLRQSTVLLPNTPRLAAALPDVDAGGLDVVLDRTRAVAMPLVLSSRRLDAPSAPASPAPPGPTWEVILAEHPEQTLVDHNQTLARQLGFRQVSYALLRAFAHPEWVEQLSALVGASIALDPVEDVYPDLPGAYPAAPEHLPPPPLAADDARTLDLPERIGPFQQGALVLHWKGLPFFYEHRLLAIAQTTTTVSAVNEVVQRDFEYVTPAPTAAVEPVETAWNQLAVRARQIHLTLRTLWDSLPPAACARWPEERPDGVHRRAGWFPDLGVVYQIVEEFSGNVEVQAEVLWDDDARAFARRQLGSRFLVDVGALAPPAAGTAGEFSLALIVQQVTRQELSRGYAAAISSLPAATQAKVSSQDKVLAFVGVMTHADAATLQAAMDPADAGAIQALHNAWDAQEPVSEAPALPPALADVLDSPVPTETRLVWDGDISDDERTALLALPGDDEILDGFRRLADAASRELGVVSVDAPLGPEQVPTALLGRVAVPVDAGSGRYTELRWAGNMADADAAALIAWPRIRALRDAVSALIDAADARSYSVELPELPEMHPWPEDLPPALAGRLGIELHRLTWNKPAPIDAERAALDALDGDDAFVAALAALMGQIEAERAVPLAPVVQRPTAATLPPALQGKLEIGPTSLAWISDPPIPPPENGPERALLASLSGDRAFQDARDRLLKAFVAGSVGPVDMAPFVPRTGPSDLPEVLHGQLVLEGATLRWRSPAPSDAQRVALAGLTADDATLDAMAALWLRIDADRSVLMTPRRPRQQDLPDWIAGQLQIESERVTWIGRLSDSSWRDFLEALAGIPGEPSFTGAIQQILASIAGQVVAVPFTIAARPAADALGILADKLIIGRALLRYHGLMPGAEVRAIASSFARAADRRAVRRLYDRTLVSGMRGRALKVRARRGSAPPSALTPITSILPPTS